MSMRKTIFIWLCTYLSLNVALNAQHIDRLGNALSSSTSSRDDLFYGIVFVIFIVLVFLLLNYVTRKQNYKRLKETSREKFKELISRRGLTQDEILLIHDWNKRTKVDFPDHFLTDRALFNKLTKEDVTNLTGKSVEEKNEKLKLLRSLREKNNFHKPPPYENLDNTKEIEANSPITVKVGAKVYKCQVMENTEEYLVVSMPDSPQTLGLKKGTIIIVGFYRQNEGHYLLKMRVAKTSGYPLNGLFLFHNYRVPLPKKRRYKRVPMHEDLTISVINGKNPSANPLQKKVVVSNFSAGGVRISNADNIKVDDFIVFSIRLDKKNFFENLRAKVIKKIIKPNDQIINAKFVRVSNRQRSA